MQLSRLSFIVCAALLCGTAYGQKQNHAPTVKLDVAPATPFTEVRRDSLLNGLQVVSLYRSGDPLVKCDIVVRGGSMFDLTGKTGLAMLTQSTLLAANPRLKDELDSLQARIDWGVTWDSTWYHVETPASNFDTVFEILTRLLVVENVRNDVFAASQKAQIEQLKAHKPTPAERADDVFLRALYGEHPYGHNLIGTEATVANIKQGDVYDFIRRFYIANNVSITTVGNIPQERVMRSFKVLFGGWTKGQITPATFRQPAQIVQARVLKMEAADIPGVEIRGGAMGVRHADPDFLAAEVMARILTERLRQEAGTGAAVAARRILSGPFYFSASLPVEKAQEFSQRATRQYASLSNAPVSDEELAAARKAVAAEYAAQPIEYFLREIEAFSLPRSYPINLQQRIEGITAADVQRVAKRLADANALTVVAYGRVGEAFKTNP